MRSDGLMQFLLRLGKGDIHDSFAIPDAFQQKLKPQSGLAGAWISLDQVQVPSRQTTVQYLVKAGDTGAQQLPVVVSLRHEYIGVLIRG